MHLRVLVVENDDHDYRDLASVLEAIPEKALIDWGVDHVDRSRAESSENAVSHLTKAADNETPYHIMILDLGIPKRKGLIPDTDNGFSVLQCAQSLRAARQTMIYTNFLNDKNILKALQGGANDFVEKPSEAGDNDQELQTRFMSCWQRALAQESATLIERRIRDLIPYAESGLAHRFTTCFSDFVQSVAHTTEDIENYAHKRFGLDRKRDSQDFLIRRLQRQEDELKIAQENWSQLKAGLLNGEELPKPVTIESVVNSIEEKLSPCRLVKNAPLSFDFNGIGQTRLLSFQDDVSVILQEIGAGALSTLPDYGKRHNINLKVQVNNGQAEIEFSDDLESGISASDQKAINSGFSVSPVQGPTRFGRAWGLSVIQHIALRGGGRLIVRPRSHKGSIVTYFAPLAS